jgi:cell division protein FtsL
MAGDRGGKSLAVAALVISLIALEISILIYREVGSTQALEEQVQALQSVVETARKETTEALRRIERAVRAGESAGRAPLGANR